ncbi:GGDEF domain-containing protein [Halioxenophilus aromaticivorans]
MSDKVIALHSINGGQSTPYAEYVRMFDGDQRNFYALVDSSYAFIAVNALFERHLQKPKENIIGMPLALMFEESTFDNYIMSAMQACMAGESITVHERLLSKFDTSGVAGHFDITFLPVTLANGENGIMMSCHDVSRYKANERKLRQLAHLDPLTQMPNLRFIDYQLRKLRAQGSRDGAGFSVVFIDFDQFKKINDVHGHLAGDQVLIEFSRRLRTKLRGGEHIGRIGGDEFLVIIREPLDADQQVSLAQRLKQIVASPFRIGEGKLVQLGISVGVAVWPHDGDTLDSLKQLADSRMYEDKKQSK